MPEWISVKDGLPEDTNPVLCWYEYFHFTPEMVLPEYGIGYYFPINKRWGGEVTVGRGAKVLYWMPLPKPPEEGGNTGGK